MGARVRVRERELRALQGEPLQKRLADLGRGATGTANGEIRDLDQAIAALEKAVGRTAAEARAALASGAMSETADVVHLLMLDRRRALLTGG